MSQMILVCGTGEA